MDIAERLRFHGIGEDTASILRSSRPALLNILPAALDAFYRHLLTFPSARTFFKSDAHVAHARSRQQDHWSVIMEARFDETYVASVTKVGEIHHQIGLEPHFYIGGYNFLLCEITRRIGQLDLAVESRLSLQLAVTRATLLDMDFAIAVYSAAGERERNLAMEQLSKFAQDSSISVQTVAAASEELVASISEISRQVDGSATITVTAKAMAEGTSTQIRSLSDAANDIGKVVNLINSIASQTNLLALNATIEAARAGDQGRGFAVVASEVKQLATQTANATKGISLQVIEIQKATAESVSAIQNMSETIDSLNRAATSIASAIEQQRAATQEISLNIQNVADRTAEVSTSLARRTG